MKNVLKVLLTLFLLIFVLACENGLMTGSLDNVEDENDSYTFYDLPKPIQELYIRKYPDLEPEDYVFEEFSIDTERAIGVCSSSPWRKGLDAWAGPTCASLGYVHDYRHIISYVDDLRSNCKHGGTEYKVKMEEKVCKRADCDYWKEKYTLYHDVDWAAPPRPETH